jgi:murein L,D-transpeptidase YcbB/YkuD
MSIFIFRVRAALMLSTAVFIFLWPGMGIANIFATSLNDDIQKRLAAAEKNPVMLCGGVVIYAPAVLQGLYRTRAFQPAWISHDRLLPQAEALLNAVRLADREGLKPEEYHLLEIMALITEWRNNQDNNLQFSTDKQIDLDFLLTDALVAYGFHLLNGRVNPGRLDPDWLSYPGDLYLNDAIENVMSTGNVEAAFQRLIPHDPLYRRLKQTLAVYTNIARNGGWPLIPQPRSLKKKADYSHYLSLLRQRLVLTGDLSPTESSSLYAYDEGIKKAVRRFQKRYGLKADGVIGLATLKEMNVPVEKRIRQITLNLERLRWLPEDIGNRYIIVNITDFELNVFQDDRVVMDMPIVVGKQNQRTSVFSGKMTYIELNPYWNIPKTIAIKEILPNVKKDPAYLKKKKIKVIEYRRRQEKEVDPAAIDWSKIHPDKLRYSFRQDFGPGNALGRLKFMFPNKFDIYLHDTPERHLFKRTQRTFSHGCIRIAKPIDLAEYLLNNEKGWNRKKILAEIGKGKRKVLKLPYPINVHILYLTAWTDHQGIVQFRNDIYKGDAILSQALNEKPRTIYPIEVSRPKEPSNDQEKAVE